MQRVFQVSIVVSESKSEKLRPIEDDGAVRRVEWAMIQERVKAGLERARVLAEKHSGETGERVFRFITERVKHFGGRGEPGRRST